MTDREVFLVAGLVVQGSQLGGDGLGEVNGLGVGGGQGIVIVPARFPARQVQGLGC